MNFLPIRIFEIARIEGFLGIHERLARRLRKLAFKFAKALNLSTFKSTYVIRMRANWSDKTFRFCALGRYGRFLSSYIENQKSAFQFLDIGANHGLYTIIAAKNRHCKGVVAFEPVPGTADLLIQNLDLNDVTGKCTIVRKAIDTSSGTALMCNPIAVTSLLG